MPRTPRVAPVAAAITTAMLMAAAPAMAQTVPAVAAGSAAPSCTLTAFRMRSDFESLLNDSTDWAGATNEALAVSADQPFRLRLELEAEGPAGQPRRFWLQYRHNGGEWTDLQAADFPYPLVTPPISVVANGEYAPGEATLDLLSGSRAPFHPGAGIVAEAATPSWTGGSAHGEWEWPLVVRRFSDQARTNDTGDTYELRVADAFGICSSTVVPTLTVTVPDGLLGGTFVETPGPIGPWQAGNGDLYFLMEPAETSNVLMVVKSSDGGRSWREVDGGHRPATGDLEGFATVLGGDTVHMLHQTSEAVFHHAFRTSDHPTAPDTWAVRDEQLAAPEEPPIQVAALAARPDGSLLGVYGTPTHIELRIRDASGRWSDATVIDPDSDALLSGPMLATGEDGVVHLAYTDRRGNAWYRTIGHDGRPGPRQHVADGLGRAETDVGSILPLVYLPDTDTLMVIYRLANGALHERRSVGGAPLGEARVVTDRVVIQGAVDSDQTAADAIALDGRAQVLFVEADSGSLFHAATGDDGEWGPATLQVDDIDGQWVRGQPVRRADGSLVYGHVYDAGSNGGSGLNRYGEVEPGAPGAE